jgi:hypothetical protein
MLTQFLPKSADNAYRGQVLALWILALVVLLKSIMSLNSVFNGYSVASAADGLPLDTYPPAAARTVVALFGAWGVGQLMLCLIGVLVLVRYRSLVPFVLALFLLEQLTRKLVLALLPIARTGTPPGYFVNLGLLAIMIAALALALWRRGDARVQASPVADPRP